MSDDPACQSRSELTAHDSHAGSNSSATASITPVASVTGTPTPTSIIRTPTATLGTAAALGALSQAATSTATPQATLASSATPAATPAPPTPTTAPVPTATPIRPMADVENDAVNGDLSAAQVGLPTPVAACAAAAPAIATSTAPPPAPAPASNSSGGTSHASATSTPSLLSATPTTTARVVPPTATPSPAAPTPSTTPTAAPVATPTAAPVRDADSESDNPVVERDAADTCAPGHPERGPDCSRHPRVDDATFGDSHQFRARTNHCTPDRNGRVAERRDTRRHPRSRRVDRRHRRPDRDADESNTAGQRGEPTVHAVPYRRLVRVDRFDQHSGRARAARSGTNRSVAGRSPAAGACPIADSLAACVVQRTPPLDQTIRHTTRTRHIRANPPFSAG